MRLEDTEYAVFRISYPTRSVFDNYHFSGPNDSQLTSRRGERDKTDIGKHDDGGNEKGELEFGVETESVLPSPARLDKITINGTALQSDKKIDLARLTLLERATERPREEEGSRAGRQSE